MIIMPAGRQPDSSQTAQAGPKTAVVASVSQGMPKDSRVAGPGQPAVGKANAWSRNVIGPTLRAAANVPALTGWVESITRKSEPLPTTDRLVNLQTVVPGILLRGGQLSKAGLARLAMQEHPGVILNLAAEYPQSKTGEDVTAQTLGIEARELAIAPMKPPTQAEAMAFIAQVDAQQKKVEQARAAGLPSPGPLYVHCYAGSDRTGALVACYRIARQGWPVEKAIAEMTRLGANQDLHPDFLAFVRDFARGAATAPQNG